MKTTDRLNEVLKSARPDDISKYLAEHEKNILDNGAFSEYMRSKIREKDLTQQEVFLMADLSEKYGYKLISGEKRTKQRDYILRLCIAAGFSLDETNKALALYGMSPLYARIPRDAAIIVALNNSINDVNAINDILKDNSFEELHQCRVPE